MFCVSIEDIKPAATAGSQASANSGTELPTNLKEYCLKLISASMNHNVERAKRLVGGSKVFPAPSTLDTFDFDGAIAKIGYEQSFYGTVFAAAQSKILQLSQLYSNVNDPNSSNLFGRLSPLKIMDSLFRIFESSMQTPDWDYVSSAFIVRAECLRQIPTQAIRSADYVVRVARIMAKSNNLVCFPSSADPDQEGSIVPTAWTCYNETQQRELTVQAIPVRNPADHARRSVTVLVFFEHPTQSINQGDVVTIRSHYLIDGAMAGLASDARTDFIRITNPHTISIAKTDIVLIYPVTFPAITVRGTGKEEQIPTTRVQREYLGTMAGYQAVGVMVQSLEPGVACRADFYASAP